MQGMVALKIPLEEGEQGDGTHTGRVFSPGLQSDGSPGNQFFGEEVGSLEPQPWLKQRLAHTDA
jgi:hypothetical protein